jgi:hypothetical protein
MIILELLCQCHLSDTGNNGIIRASNHAQMTQISRGMDFCKFVILKPQYLTRPATLKLRNTYLVGNMGVRLFGQANGKRYQHSPRQRPSTAPTPMPPTILFFWKSLNTKTSPVMRQLKTQQIHNTASTGLYTMKIGPIVPSLVNLQLISCENHRSLILHTPYMTARDSLLILISKVCTPRLSSTSVNIWPEHATKLSSRRLSPLNLWEYTPTSEGFCGLYNLEIAIFFDPGVAIKTCPEYFISYMGGTIIWADTVQAKNALFQPLRPNATPAPMLFEKSVLSWTY